MKTWMIALLALLAMPLGAQIPAPQIAFTGNFGCAGFPCVNSGVLPLTTDADHTMTALETSAAYIKVTSSVPLTATRNLFYPAGRFPAGIENATMGGQILNVCGPSGSCVPIPNSNTAYTPVWNDGTNFVSGAGTGGSVSTLPFSSLTSGTAATGGFIIGNMSSLVPLGGSGAVVEANQLGTTSGSTPFTWSTPSPNQCLVTDSAGTHIIFAACPAALSLYADNGVTTGTNIHFSAASAGITVQTPGGAGSNYINFTLLPFVASGSSHAIGAVPDPGATAGTTKFLREDSTWAVPSGGGSSALITGGQGSALPAQAVKYVSSYPHFSWLRGLSNCANAPVESILLASSYGNVWAGDGSGEGPTLFSQTFGQIFATQGFARCGFYGTGINPAIKFLSSGSPNPDHLYYTTTGTTAQDATYGPNQTANSAGTLLKLSPGATITYTTTGLPVIEQSVDTVYTYCVQGPSFGTLSTSINSTTGTSLASTSCGGTAGSATGVVVSNGTPFTAQPVNVVSTCPSGPGLYCYFYANRATVGTKGFEFNNLSGASGNVTMATCASCFAWVNLLSPAPSLIITDFSTNEPNQSLTTSQYATGLGSIISSAAALSSHPSVEIMQPPVSGNTNASQMPAYSAAGLAVAQSNNTGFISNLDLWGTTYIPALFGSDGVHPGVSGSALEAEQLIDDTFNLTVPTSGFIAGNCSSLGTNYFVTGFTSTGSVTCGQVSGSSGTCGAGYAHSGSISLAAATGGTPLANFPAVIGFNGATINAITNTNLRTTGNGGQVTSSVAADITFCSAPSSGTVLPFELVANSYVPSTGAAEYYVSVPALSVGGPTQMFVFWGNASASSAANPVAVWTNAGASAVYHFGTAGALSYADSTTNANNLTATGTPTATAGQFGGAASFTSAQYLVNSSPTGLPGGSTARTVEGWIKFPSAPSSTIMFAYGTCASGPSIGCYAPAVIPSASQLYALTSQSADYGSTSYTVPTSTWSQYAFVAAGPNVNTNLVYVNGAAQTVGVIQGSPSTTTFATGTSLIEINGGNGDGTISAAEIVDEIRIYNSAKSAAWVAAEYAEATATPTYTGIN